MIFNRWLADSPVIQVLENSMGKDLRNYDYDKYLSGKANNSRGARRELEQRKTRRKEAHDSSGVGYHFGIDDHVVKVESKEHFKHELDKRGLMMKHEVKKELR